MSPQSPLRRGLTACGSPRSNNESCGRSGARSGSSGVRSTPIRIPNDYAVTNPGMEQLDLLEDEGADLTKVIIGHSFIQNTGMHQLYEICDRGATVNVDHIGIPWKHGSIDELDGILAEQICDLVEKGYADRITFSYDRWFFNPRAEVTDLDPEFLNARVPWGYLFDAFVPRLLKMGIDEKVIQQILVDNPRRLLSFDG